MDTLFPERAKLSGIAQRKWDLKFVIDINVEQYADLFEIGEKFQPVLVVGEG